MTNPRHAQVAQLFFERREELYVYLARRSAGVCNLRPDVMAGQPLAIAGPNVAGEQRFNHDAFEIPMEFPGRLGTLGRNVLRGFGLAQLNLTVRREIPTRESLRPRICAEMFNAPNRPSFAGPVGMLHAPPIGYSTRMLGRSLGRDGVNGGLNPLHHIGGPRSIQLALRMVF